MDPYHFEPVGNVHLALRDMLEAQNSASIQAKRVVGIVQVSGSGKTKLYFSLGEHTDFDVVFIRLYDRTLTRPFQLLKQEIESLAHTHIENKADQLANAKEGLELIRLFIAAHFIWLLGVSPPQPGHKGRLWLYALHCSLGNEAVHKIFRGLVLARKTSSERFGRPLLEHLEKKMRVVSGQKILVAFDEITVARGMGKGVFFHLFEGETPPPLGYVRHIEEMESKHATTRHADLYYMLRVQMLHLQELSFGVAMSDTTFSLFDALDQNQSSPLNGRIAHLTELHFVTKAEMTAFIGKFFEMSAPFEQALEDMLHAFEGRPHFFFMTFCPALFRQCQIEMPKDATEFQKLLNADFVRECFEECIANIHKEVIARNWDRSEAPNSASPTISQDLKMLHAAMMMGGTVTAHSQENFDQLVKTGLLFMPECSFPQVIQLREPIILEALDRHGCRQILRGSDHVMEYLSRPFRPVVSNVFDAVSFKGDLTENFLAWYILREAMKTRDSQLQQLQQLPQLPQLATILQPLFPPNFDWPHTFADATVCISKSVALADDPFSLLLGANPPLETIFRGLPPDLRSDLVIPFFMNGTGVLCIQCNAKQAIDLQDALWSVSSGCQYYSTKKPEILKLYESSFSDQKEPITLEKPVKTSSTKQKKQESTTGGEITKSAARTKFEESIKDTSIQDRWLRAVFSVKPFSKQLVKKVNALNPRLRQPIILLQASEETFGKEVFSLLTESGSGDINMASLPTREDFYWDGPFIFASK